MLKIHSLPGKVKYSGPSNFADICRAIVKDANDAGIVLSYGFVYRVIRLFFGRITLAMKNGFFISIKDFGDFGMTKEEKKKRVWKDELAARKRYIKYAKKIIKIKQRKKKHSKLDKINSYRATNGMKPLTIDEYIIISRKRKPPKPRKISRFNYTFEVLDELEESK